MSIAFAQFVIDCQDPAAQAGFWSGVLGVPVDPGASPYFATVGRGGERPLRPAWMFIKVPEPRIGKNRVHADLVATDGRPRSSGWSAWVPPGSPSSTNTAPAG